MTCIGRASLSLGRGAELVEAERGDIDASPSQSPYGDSRPRAHSLALRAIHLASPQRGGGCEHSEQMEGCYMYL